MPWLRPHVPFGVTNGIEEGISCTNSSSLNSKQTVWTCHQAHSCDEFAPFSIVFERVGCVFQHFFFFKVRQAVIIKKTLKCLELGSTVYQDSWGWKGLISIWKRGLTFRFQPQTDCWPAGNHLVHFDHVSHNRNLQRTWLDATLITSASLAFVAAKRLTSVRAVSALGRGGNHTQSVAGQGN